ncbi:hypothetical protein DFH27DRAFT_610351 [Peziza echinospora]|nr:hypothetical protein DFH27DRAFT_610351 [Peziza echinospora]
MGEPAVPSYIFTVRHGSRLDAADNSWHLTSATPYDTPLTYGGWLQSRSLGFRIASILNSRSSSPTASSLNLADSKQATSGTKKRKRTRILIHTSPFLRCIQTSISISAGISMYWGKNANADSGEYIKPILRVDAWLGEWLTPDYFTEISPPPGAPLLAATAKAELMRPSSAHAIKPALTGAPLNTLSKDLSATLPTAGYTPPTLNYAVSPSGPIPRGHVSHAKEYIDIDYPWDSTKFGAGGEYGEEWASMHKRFRHGYKKMLVWFATHDGEYTTSKTTWGKPMGSKRPSVSTAGGSSGVSSTESTPQKKKADVPEVNETSKEEEEEEIETVVILVTHGAGCNALIGAMTDKPVLMDIGLASMTMAERVTKSPLNTPAIAPRKNSYSTGIIPPPPVACHTTDLSKLDVAYDVKLTASTEHLRKGSMAAMLGGSGGASPKLVGRDTPPPALSAFRSRYGGGAAGPNGISSGLSNWSLNGSGNISPITEHGVGLDNVSKGAGPRRSSVASTSSSTGLWSRPMTANNEAAEDGEVSPGLASVSRRNSTTGGTFIDRERVNRGRGGRDRSHSNRTSSLSIGTFPDVDTTTKAQTEAEAEAEAEVAAGSEESDDAVGPPSAGLWGQKKQRRWTMGQAN